MENLFIYLIIAFIVGCTIGFRVGHLDFFQYINKKLSMEFNSRESALIKKLRDEKYAIITKYKYLEESVKKEYENKEEELSKCNAPDGKGERPDTKCVEEVSHG